ncbi:MAG: DUF1365 domain-containing protein [Pseudomonadota bacterium]
MTIEEATHEKTELEKNEPGARLYEGVVKHHRLRPKPHKLAYRVFNFFIDIDRLDEVSAQSRFFSRNRFNLFSLYDRDYGHGAPEDIAAFTRAALAEANLPSDGKILLLTYPRILGYGFNPISVFYCYDRQEKLRALIYEVRNTFGERHSYLIEVDPAEQRAGQEIRQRAKKVFHVSPFMEMDMCYDFTIMPPSDEARIVIRAGDAQGPMINAHFRGKRAAFSDKKLIAVLFSYPLMTLKVIVGIHYEAVKMLFKGYRLRAGAPAPTNPFTVIRNGSNAPSRQ